MKRSVCDLFDELARLEDGTVVKLEFRYGLPVLAEIVLVAAPDDMLMDPESQSAPKPEDNSA